MANATSGFYQSLADCYHLMFDDWDKSIERQALALSALLSAYKHPGPLKVLDCACGIGTQSIGLAMEGHQVVGSDLSEASISRARREAKIRNLNIQFYVADMTSLEGIPDADFDVVAALDNALPHLTVDQLAQAVRSMNSKLKPGGLFLASIRDYDHLILERPAFQGPVFYGKQNERRIVHQVWDWLDQERYGLHIFITLQSEDSWTCHHFAGQYRCVLRSELSSALEHAGFVRVRWLMPENSHFYQPLVLAEKP